MNAIHWRAGTLELAFSTTDSAPVSLMSAPGIGHDRDLEVPDRHAEPQYLVEVLAIGHGRQFTSTRLTQTAIGHRMRYASHKETKTPNGSALRITQLDSKTGLEATVTLEYRKSSQTLHAVTSYTNTSSSTLHLLAVSTLALGNLSVFIPLNDPTLWQARSEWCAESRWQADQVNDLIPNIDVDFHKHVGRGSYKLTSTSSWSTGQVLPLAVLEDPETKAALGWQVEHNGPWSWEINARYFADDAFTLSLSGPNDLDHQWHLALEQGQTFESVPATITWSQDGRDGVFQNLTKYRRDDRPFPTADSSLPLIFNDYMNALMGDPTTEKLLPLIDAAAQTGVEVFCIDCGWYDDGGNWWPSVGAWEPSTKRFGHLGLEGVLKYIRDKGMAPGLWVEPEVIGVDSPVAKQLPDSAFMTRHGIRLEEHSRYFLDMRSDEARAHLDRVFKRLIEDYGVGYFKWDYNVTPGSGPAADHESTGQGLLDHSRALLSWIEELRLRYPHVILESCSSGAMRMDHATTRLYDLQSSTDQQSFLNYPTVASGAAAMLAPERSGNWAYPQGDDSAEVVAFNLVTGLSGRLYLSGHLNELPDHCMELVREAARLYPEIIKHNASGLPTWPTGLPRWTDPVVSLGSRTDSSTLVFAWVREETSTPIEFALPDFEGKSVSVEQVFPSELPKWGTTWDGTAGVLAVSPPTLTPSARILRVTSI